MSPSDRHGVSALDIIAETVSQSVPPPGAWARALLEEFPDKAFYLTARDCRDLQKVVTVPPGPRDRVPR